MLEGQIVILYYVLFYDNLCCACALNKGSSLLHIYVYITDTVVCLVLIHLVITYFYGGVVHLLNVFAKNFCL